MFSLEIPQYERATMRFIKDVVQGFLDKDQLLKDIPRETTMHSGPIRNIAEDPPLDQSLAPITTDFIFPLDTVRNSKIDDYVRTLYDFAQNFRKSLAQHVFRSIGEITDITGRSIDAKGKPFTFDMFLDLLEKIEFDFDDDGKPLYPTMVVPPALLERLKKLQPTPEQDKRQQQIVLKQWERFNANKRTRRLLR